MKKLVMLSLLFVLSFGLAQADPFDLKEKQEVKTEFVTTLTDVVDFIDVEVSGVKTYLGYDQVQFDAEVVEAIKLPAVKVRWCGLDNSIIFNESIPKEPLVNLLNFRQKVLRG